MRVLIDFATYDFLSCVLWIVPRKMPDIPFGPFIRTQPKQCMEQVIFTPWMPHDISITLKIRL